MKSLILCLIVGISMAAGAADWPQFCGPDRNNVSAETGLADSWPAGGPKVLWETEVHAGYSGPAIKDGKAYLIDRDGEKSLLRCLDMNSGRQLWVVSFEDPGTMSAKYAGTRGTPTVTDNAVYFVTGYGSLACVDLSSKKVKWKHSLIRDYDNKLHKFGIAQSPSLYGNMLLVAPNSKDTGVAAYDRVSGERLWVSPGLGFHSYISPRVESVCGEDMVIAIGSAEKGARGSQRKKDEEKTSEPEKKPAPAHVVGLSPRDGSILWDYTDWQCNMAIPHPVILPGDRFFITGGYKAGSAMIQLVRKGDDIEVKELYRTDEVGSQLQQPIHVGDHLFIGSNSNSRKDGLTSFTLDGKLEWRTKDIDGAPNFERGPFILADRKLIMLDGKTGVLHLVKADPRKFQLLASAKMVREKDMAWAPLALSDGRLLVRDWNKLKCVDLR